MTPCEALATKAELNELRAQINALLGQKEDGTGQVDVLQQGTLAGTAAGAGIALGATAIQDIVVENVADPDIMKDFARGRAQWMKVKGSGTRVPLPDLSTISKTAGRTAVTTGAVATTAAATTAAVTSMAALAAAAGATLVGVATLKVLGKRIDANEAATNQFNNGYTSLINLLSKQGMDIDATNDKLANNEATIAQQQQDIGSISSELEQANIDIQDLTTTVYERGEQLEQTDAELQELAARLQATETELGDGIAELQDNVFTLQSQVASGKLTQQSLQQTTTQLMGETVRLSLQNDFQNERLRNLEITSTVNRSQLVELKLQLEATDAEQQQELDNLELEVVKQTKKRRLGGGGGASPEQEKQAVDTQNTIVDVLEKLTGTETPKRDIEGYEAFSGNNPFSEFISDLLPNLDPNDFQMNQQQLDDFGNTLKIDIDDIIKGAIGISLVPKLIEIQQQTTQEKMTQAATEGVCQTTQPNGCMTNNVTNPILNGQKGLGNAISNARDLLSKNIGDLINAGLNAKILTIVQSNNKILADGVSGLKATSEFMKKAWSTVPADKIMNTIGTMAAIHNAAMLSRNAVETMGDAMSAGLRLFGIKNPLTGEFIDVNEALGTSIRNTLIRILGVNGYRVASETWLRLNRIHQTAGAVCSAVVGAKDALMEAEEATGGNVAKIGNALQEQGIIAEDSYRWMDDEPDYRRHFGGVLGLIESVEDTGDRVSRVVNSGLELKDSRQEIKDSLKEFDKAIEDFNTLKQGEQDTKDTNNNFPALSSDDLAQYEPEGE